MKAKQRKEIEENPAAWIRSTAKFFWNVFHDESDYIPAFIEKLLAGGGGNSMFNQSWVFTSSLFVQRRISSEAVKVLEELGLSKNNIPHDLLHDNAKGEADRKAIGKLLHEDHCPGNVKVMHLIRDKIRSYPLTATFEDIADDLCEFLKTVQTLDIITVKQDDMRTLKSSGFVKKQKDMFTHEERDALLDDEWEDM
jgi:hypothetical protein